MFGHVRFGLSHAAAQLFSVEHLDELCVVCAIRTVHRGDGKLIREHKAPCCWRRIVKIYLAFDRQSHHRDKIKTKEGRKELFFTLLSTA